MANMEKYSDAQTIVYMFRHNTREAREIKNPDVNREKSHLNTSIIGKKYGDYKKRLDEIYVYGRKDTVTLASWIVTLPKDYDGDEKEFFEKVNEFLVMRYGEKNAMQSIVHRDESGQPHLHFTFVPVVKDEKFHKPSGEKLGSKWLLNRFELLHFHPELQKFLKANGIDANIQTGITRKQGGNKTVTQLKRERELQKAMEINTEIEL